MHRVCAVFAYPRRPTSARGHCAPVQMSLCASSSYDFCSVYKTLSYVTSHPVGVDGSRMIDIRL